MDNLFENVKQFIIRERWEYDFELKPEISLQNDLKIYGDDASEILSRFCDEFNVSYKNFRFDDYFRPEPSWVDFFKKKKKYKNLTIRSLMEAVERSELI